MTNEIIDKYLAANHNYHMSDSKFRKSLRGWIMIGLNLCDKAYEGDPWTAIELLTYQYATENIEDSLEKPWSQICEELENLEN